MLVEVCGRRDLLGEMNRNASCRVGEQKRAHTCAKLLVVVHALGKGITNICFFLTEDAVGYGNVSVSNEIHLNHFQTVFLANDSEPEHFTISTYARAWNGRRRVLHTFTSHCFLLFLLYFQLLLFSMQQINRFCI